MVARCKGLAVLAYFMFTAAEASAQEAETENPAPTVVEFSGKSPSGQGLKLPTEEAQAELATRTLLTLLFPSLDLMTEARPKVHSCLRWSTGEGTQLFMLKQSLHRELRLSESCDVDGSLRLKIGEPLDAKLRLRLGEGESTLVVALPVEAKTTLQRSTGTLELLLESTRASLGASSAQPGLGLDFGFVAEVSFSVRTQAVSLKKLKLELYRAGKRGPLPGKKPLRSWEVSSGPS